MPDDKQISEDASFLSILFLWKQKCFVKEHGRENDIGSSTAFDSIMSSFCKITHRQDYIDQLGSMMAWAKLILHDSIEEWPQLATARRSQSLHAWYRSTYLTSRLWKSLRGIVLADAKRQCLVCRRSANTVHHTSYDDDVMRGLDLRYLWPVCDGCHHTVEFNGGRKASIFESSDRLDKLYRDAMAARGAV